MSSATVLRTILAAVTVAGASLATTVPVQAGYGGGQFATILLQQRWQQRHVYTYRPAPRPERGCWNCYAKPRHVPQIVRKDDDDTPVARKRIGQKPAAAPKQVVTVAPPAPAKPAAPKIAALPAAPATVPSSEPGAETFSLPPVDGIEPGAEMSTPLVDGNPIAPVAGEPVRTAATPGTAAAGECKRFLPSIGQTISVPCTE